MVNDVHVIRAPGVKSVVRNGTPEVTPSFKRPDQQWRYNATLLLHQQFQAIYVVQVRLRIDGKIARAFHRKAVIPKVEKKSVIN